MKLFQKYRIRETVRWAYHRYMYVIAPIVGTDSGELADYALANNEDLKKSLCDAYEKLFDDRYPAGIDISRSGSTTDVDADISGFSHILAPSVHRLSRTGSARLERLMKYPVDSCKTFCLELVKIENDWHTNIMGEMNLCYGKCKAMPVGAWNYFMERFAIEKYRHESTRP